MSFSHLAITIILQDEHHSLRVVKLTRRGVLWISTSLVRQDSNTERGMGGPVINRRTTIGR